MYKFEVGDIVVGNGVESGLDITGMVGRVIESGLDNIPVEFENEHGAFHDCAGLCKPHHGFYVYRDKLLLADDGIEINDDIEINDIDACVIEEFL